MHDPGELERARRVVRLWRNGLSPHRRAACATRYSESAAVLAVEKLAEQRERGERLQPLIKGDDPELQAIAIAAVNRWLAELGVIRARQAQ